MTLRKPFLYALSISLGLMAATGVIAWTGPSQGAPNGNASAPLNVSASGQTKVGGLRVNSGGAATGLEVVSGLTVLNGALNIGGDLTTASGAVFQNNGDIYMPWAGNWLSTVLSNNGNGNMRYDTWYGSSYYGSNGNIFLGYVSDWLSNRLNQAVTTNSAPTFNGLTSTGGLTVGNGGGAYTYINLRDDESPNGLKYIHANSNVIGFLSGQGGWISRWDNAGYMWNTSGATFAGNVTVAGATLFTNGDLYMPWAGNYLSTILNSKGGGNMSYDTWYGSSYYGSGGNIYLGYVSDWLSNRLNQAVTTNSQPQFARMYDDDPGYYIDSNTTSRVNAITAVGAITANGGLTVSEADVMSRIRMMDDESPNGLKYIHANSNLIGFLSGQGGWISRWDNAGYMWNTSGATFAGTITVGSATLDTDGSLTTVQGAKFLYNGDIYMPYNGRWLSTALGWNGSNYSPTFGTVTAAAFYYSSDERLKKNIETISSSKALRDILALNPVTYDWKDPAADPSNQLGFVAQEVEKIAPELVRTNTQTDMKSVDYARVAPLLVGAVQEQQAKIDAQQKQLDFLMAEVRALKAAR